VASVFLAIYFMPVVVSIVCRRYAAPIVETDGKAQFGGYIMAPEQVVVCQDAFGRSPRSWRGVASMA
jgi:hypothetical protein